MKASVRYCYFGGEELSDPIEVTIVTYDDECFLIEDAYGRLGTAYWETGVSELVCRNVISVGGNTSRSCAARLLGFRL